MKKLLILVCLIISCLGATAQKENPDYDPALAKTLNGDENGMKKYVMAVLKTGSNTTADKISVDTLFAGHMKNIKRLADNGSLSVAGPLGKNDNNYRGIFILNVSTFEEAQNLLATDPAIREKLLEPELFILWCTAGLQEIPKIHNKIQKFVD